MKKVKTLITTALCLCTMCALALPAHGVAASSVSLASAYGESSLTSLRLLSPQSLEGGFVGAPQYTFGAPSGPEYGKATSVEPVVTADRGETPNVDVSKNAALIPPVFGSASAYTLNTGTPLTPNLAPGYMLGEGVAIGGAGSGSSDGITVTPPDFSGIVSSGTAAYPGVSASTVGYTEVTSDLYYSGGYLAVLAIPSQNVSVKVYQGTDSDALAKGAGHFEETSIWDGNCAIASHNRGVSSYFGNIHTLSVGDTIILTTRLGTRTYAVTSVNKISNMDNSLLAPTAENCVTLFTCVANESAYRWAVRAVEI